MKKRYLTKSRFKLAQECPAKLFYTGKKDEYADKKIEDSFLEALAEGGFQVGELAKCYYPGGHDIKTLDYEESLAETNELLKLDEVVIFEAAVRYKMLFCRVDILVKNKNHIELIEVKAKSFESSDNDPFMNTKGITSTWRPYLEDVAFQKYVFEHSFPEFLVAPFLMMADKDTLCPTNGLNQKFKIFVDQQGRKDVKTSPPVTKEDLSKPILGKINVCEQCNIIYDENYGDDSDPVSYEELIAHYADCYADDIKIKSPISKGCKSCEFRASDKDKTSGLKSGFEECWQEQVGWTDKDFEEPTIFEIWDFRKKDKLIKDGRLKLAEVTESDIAPVGKDGPGISRTERQWLQVEKAQNKDITCWVDKEGLANEMAGWVYPLHFIDFETSAPAIPFNKGLRPYEGIAFQFSHHLVLEDGSIEHHGEYINIEPGKFPNYDFVRALKKELEQDKGSVFRYSHHENTYLNMIYRQLTQAGSSVKDGRELCDFIRTITNAKKDYVEQWAGDRSMIDMCELVKNYYYDPYMKGSNSIKVVLPAILNGSAYLQKKYAEPIYGAQGGIKSLNYTDKTWVERDEDGKVKDPYQLLPTLFEDLTPEEQELLDAGELFMTNDELHDGGAAMTAYCKLQFAEMSDVERKEVERALLKYCELDTFAMVMIYEGWKDLIRQ